MSRVEQYCGPPGLSLSDVVRASLRNDRVLPAWPQLPRDRSMPTLRARNAIAIGCEMLGLGSEGEVLMPSYNCGTEIEAVRSTGASVSLYRVDRKGRVDCEDLVSRLTRRTRAVAVTHYFGWPQDLTEIAAFCCRHGLLLIEDCALSLFSADGSTPLGHRGDAAVFSFPKTLAVPDGGALLLRGELPFAPRSPGPSSIKRVARRCAGLLRQRVKRQLAGSRKVAADRQAPIPTDQHGVSLARADMPSDYYWDDRTSEVAISGMTLGILNDVDPDAVAARRRANYKILCERVRELRVVAPLFDDLPAGVCPLEFPLIVNDKLSWVASLRTRGVEAIPWWSGYHRDLPWDEFPDACYLKDHLLALPVNQDLDAQAMDYIASCIEAIARADRRNSLC